MSKEVRRHRRIPYVGVIRLSWEDANGHPQFAQAQCVDISPNGIRLEMYTAVTVRTRLLLNAERIKLAGAASVKHVARYGAKYIVGLELSETLREKTLQALSYSL